MKILIAIAVATTISLVLPMTVHGHVTDEPHDEPATVNQNVSIAPATDATVDRQAAIARLRQPAALKPLLLVPLALILYVAYERLARRRRP